MPYLLFAPRYDVFLFLGVASNFGREKMQTKKKIDLIMWTLPLKMILSL